MVTDFTFVKKEWLKEMAELVETEEKLLATPGQLPADNLLIQAKKEGFSDKYIAKILGIR